MAGTWPLARAAIVARLDGLTATGGPTLATETLKAFEYAPGGRQSAGQFPYAFIWPGDSSVGRGPTSFREIFRDIEVRVVLSPATPGSMEVLQMRYDAWWDALTTAWDAAATLDGTADISVEQEFTGLVPFTDVETGWGFVMRLLNVRISEVAAFSA